MNNKHNNPERDQFQAPDGAEIALWRWPQSKARPTVHWAHATGFHGRLYRPLLDELATDVNVLAWDMRGHGASATVRSPRHPAPGIGRVQGCCAYCS